MFPRDSGASACARAAVACLASRCSGGILVQRLSLARARLFRPLALCGPEMGHVYLLLVVVCALPQDVS